MILVITSSPGKRTSMLSTQAAAEATRSFLAWIVPRGRVHE